MKFHPITHIIVAAELAAFTVILPVYDGLALLAIWLLLTLVVPQRTDTKLTKTFIKVLAAAAFFLFLIHGVKWIPPGISAEGLKAGLISFTHIAAPVTFIIYLSRKVQSEEIFALLIDFRVPPALVLILFRTIWLVPRFVEKIDEVVTAQKLRGMRIETAAERFRALLPTLGPIFSSMFEEISENSLTLTTRGFLQPGSKSHLIVLRYGRIDLIIIVIATLILFVSWF